MKSLVLSQNLRSLVSAGLLAIVCVSLTAGLTGCSGTNQSTDSGQSSQNTMSSKDACEALGRRLTVKLFEKDRKTLAKHTNDLHTSGEISPAAVSKLEQQGLLERSVDDATKSALALEKAATDISLQMDSSQQGEVKEGKIPVDVKGTLIKTSPKGRASQPFHIRYIMVLQKVKDGSAYTPVAEEVTVLPN